MERSAAASHRMMCCSLFRLAALSLSLGRLGWRSSRSVAWLPEGSACQPSVCSSSPLFASLFRTVPGIPSVAAYQRTQGSAIYSALSSSLLFHRRSARHLRLRLRERQVADGQSPFLARTGHYHPESSTVSSGLPASIHPCYIRPSLLILPLNPWAPLLFCAAFALLGWLAGWPNPLNADRPIQNTQIAQHSIHEGLHSSDHHRGSGSADPVGHPA